MNPDIKACLLLEIHLKSLNGRCLNVICLIFGIKHIELEPGMEAGRPFIVVRTDGKLNYTGLILSLKAFLLPPLFGVDISGVYKGTL